VRLEALNTIEFLDIPMEIDIEYEKQMCEYEHLYQEIFEDTIIHQNAVIDEQDNNILQCYDC
jgi:hypothetical protein